MLTLQLAAFGHNGIDLACIWEDHGFDMGWHLSNQLTLRWHVSNHITLRWRQHPDHNEMACQHADLRWNGWAHVDNIEHMQMEQLHLLGWSIQSRQKGGTPKIIIILVKHPALILCVGRMFLKHPWIAKGKKCVQKMQYCGKESAPITVQKMQCGGAQMCLWCCKKRMQL